VKAIFGTTMPRKRPSSNVRPTAPKKREGNSQPPSLPRSDQAPSVASSRDAPTSPVRVATARAYPGPLVQSDDTRQYGTNANARSNRSRCASPGVVRAKASALYASPWASNAGSHMRKRPPAITWLTSQAATVGRGPRCRINSRKTAPAWAAT
jgi:hypothetical protein